MARLWLDLFRDSKAHVRSLWMHSPDSTVRPTVPTDPSRKQSFLKTPFFRKALRFSVDEKKIGKCEDNHGIFLTKFSSTTDPKGSVIVGFPNPSGVVWKENI